MSAAVLAPDDNVDDDVYATAMFTVIIARTAYCNCGVLLPWFNRHRGSKGTEDLRHPPSLEQLRDLLTPLLCLLGRRNDDLTVRDDDDDDDDDDIKNSLPSSGIKFCCCCRRPSS